MPRTNRLQGCTSKRIMLKLSSLRLLHDDTRGVGEVLNETACIPEKCEGLTDENDWVNSHALTFSGIDPSYALPNNTAVITLQELENREVLLRLAHLYEIGEDKDYSVLANVELKKLFPTKKVKAMDKRVIPSTEIE
ncbi:hypothetical protein C1H46_038969 [Malus baccata]|uniref:Uncharacterized protein n=1 Tax=Malus baccata TaxID=106549 RepID=A0A540KMN1_MALBA|nr:hypothetical protein C1H46_038969 [Malus baccata]